MRDVVFEAAHWLGLVPLAWLVVARVRGRVIDVSYWWMALAFAVSFVADLAPHRYAHQLYPVLQAGLFAIVLAPRATIGAVTLLVASTAAYSVVWRQGQPFDVWLRVTAWLTVAGLAWHLPPIPTLRWTRTTLAVGFTAMTAAWCWYVADPGWWPWGALQVARAGTTAAWCVAAWREG
jgi:hypothetical protein